MLPPIDTQWPLPYTGALDAYFVQRTLSRQPCQLVIVGGILYA
jgi:hypothetical protein